MSYGASMEDYLSMKNQLVISPQKNGTFLVRVGENYATMESTADVFSTVEEFLVQCPKATDPWKFP